MMFRTVALPALLSLGLSACNVSDDLFMSPPSSAPLSEQNTLPADMGFTPLEDVAPRRTPLRVAVFDIPDLTGANRANPNFAEASRALTQGAEALVIDSLSRVGGGTWFTLVERAALQALTEERRIDSAQTLEARQRAHVTAERTRVAEAIAALDAEIAQIRAQVDAEYAAIEESGQRPDGLPSYAQTQQNIQNLYTQRRSEIEQEKPFSAFEGGPPVPALGVADYLITGAIVAYESDIQTNGLGVRFFNIGAQQESRTDAITVNLRLVRISDGVILGTHTINQTVRSRAIGSNGMGYVTADRILDVEAGTAINEPKTFALDAAFQRAIHGLLGDIERLSL